MKTLGRILMILAVFVVAMGITYGLVNASSSSTTALALERGVEGFSRPDGVQPPFPNDERPDFDGAHPGAGSWILGLVKNTGIIAIIVALIAVPKNLLRRKPLPVRVR